MGEIVHRHRYEKARKTRGESELTRERAAVLRVNRMRSQGRWRADREKPGREAGRFPFNRHAAEDALGAADLCPRATRHHGSAPDGRQAAEDDEHAGRAATPARARERPALDRRT